MMYPLEWGIILLQLVARVFCQQQQINTIHILKRDTDIFNQSNSILSKTESLEFHYVLNETTLDDRPNGSVFEISSSFDQLVPAISRNGTRGKRPENNLQSLINSKQKPSNSNAGSFLNQTGSSSPKYEMHQDSFQIEKPESNGDSTAVPTNIFLNISNISLNISSLDQLDATHTGTSATMTTLPIPRLQHEIQDPMLGDAPDKPRVKIVKPPTSSSSPSKSPITSNWKNPQSLTSSMPKLAVSTTNKPVLRSSPVSVKKQFFVPTYTTSSKPAIKIKAVTSSSSNVVPKKIPISSTRAPISLRPALSASHAACKGIMPSYRSVVVNGSYDVRDYPLSAWLSTTVITNNRILAELEARNKLQNYFKGDNEKGIILGRTCPVLTQIKFKGESAENKEKVEEYAVSFFLPWNGNSEIPSPNDSEVLVDIVEERSLYVHSFKAYVWEMSDSFLQAEAKRLTTELRRQGEPFLSKYFYIASYAKGPVEDEYVTYEIWVYATRSRPSDIALAWQPVTEQPLGEVSRRTRSRVCKGYECPSFEVLSIHKVGIQKRRYYGARFATYDPEFCTFTKASIWRAFMPLHLYKHGVNSHFEVIGATRPAGIVHVKEKHADDINGTKEACNKTFTVSLYLPKRLHAAPPVAGNSAPRIKITELDDVIVYVQSVGGFLLVPDRIEKEVRLFRSRLKEQNLCFREGEYYLAVYDYITRFHGRLNEIWTIADRCSDSL